MTKVSHFPRRASASVDAIHDRQTLWHLERPQSPTVTGVLYGSAPLCVLRVIYGRVVTRLHFSSELDAVERAEILLSCLEGSGYRRTRRDLRGAKTGR